MRQKANPKAGDIPDAIAASLRKDGAQLQRALTVQRSDVDEEARTVSMAFASETPVERAWGTEILDCTSGSMRTERLQIGANLLCDHDQRDVVGVVEKISIGADRVGRAVVRFGRSARAEEVFRDVVDGIRRNVSVGYLIHRAVLVETADDQEVYRVTDWEPYELSLVSIPADASVGVGRSLAQPVETPPQPAEENSMTIENTTPAAPVVQTPAARNHAIEISAMAAQIPGGADLAMRSIQAGHTVEQFQAEALRHLRTDPIPAPALNAAERKEYSYVRAIAAALARAEGHNASGLEVEISQDMERNLPSNAKRNGGIYVPLTLRSPIAEALYNVSTKGASTVFTQPGDFIELLRNASTAVALGARIMSGLTGPVSFPKQTGGATVYWMPENDSTNVTASNATLGSVPLAPKTMQGTTAFSRQLMAQSSLDIEAFIRQDLAAATALAWDLAVFHGAGSSNEPTGIYAASDVNSKAMGGVPTFGKLIDMVTEVMKDNALAGQLAFVTTPGTAGKLAQTVVAASTDTRMIWDGKLNDGMMCGYRAVATNQISSTLGGGAEHGLIFGNFSEVLVGTWGGLELVVDPYSLKKQGMIEVTSFQMADIALRHGQSFCKATGSTIV